MARGRTARSAALLVASLLWAGAPAAEPAAVGPVERVVLVTVDTLRADHVGVYGGPVATPAIDALAAEGVRVRGACTPTPSTGPALASLLTGLHPWHHGALDNAVSVDPALPRLAAAFRAHGFTTAAFVGSYLVHSRFGFAEGFEHYVFEPSEAYVWRGERRGAFWTRGERVVRAAMSWLTAHADERFFLWVHLFDPHTPYAPPPGFALAPSAAVDLEGKQVPPGVRGRRHLARLIRAYRGEVAYADAQIGRLVERLRILGLLESTAVVLTSDHGEGLGDHALLEHGSTLYDELVLVPLVLRAPNLPSGQVLEGPAQLEDLAPTLLALAGAPVPAGLDGLDLLPWLSGRHERSPRASVVGRRKTFEGHPDLFFRRAWPEKWIGAREGPGERFRLERDPRERSPEPDEARPESLAGAMARPAAAVPPLDDEARRGLEALGYLDPR